MNDSMGNVVDQFSLESLATNTTEGRAAYGGYPLDNTDPLISTAVHGLIRRVVNCYIRQIVVWFGIFGNVISGVVFWKQQGLRDRVTMLLFALTVADLVSLLNHQLLLVRCYMTDPVLRATWLAICYTRVGYLILIFHLVSQALITIISMDRCLCVVWPLKARRMLSYRFLVVTIVMTYVLPFALYLPSMLEYSVLWTTDPATQRTVGRVQRTPWFSGNMETSSRIRNYYGLIIKPTSFAIIVVCSSITVVSLRRAHSRRSQLTGKGAGVQGGEEEAKITQMLLFLCLVFAVLVLSEFCTLVAVEVAPGFSMYDKYHETVVTTYAFIMVASSLNSSANVVAYLLLSSRFRATLRELCSCGSRTPRSADPSQGKRPGSGQMRRQ